MNLNEFFKDKSIKNSEKTVQLSEWLAENPGELGTLIGFAGKAKDAVKGACIEAIEHVTLKDPRVMTDEAFGFVVMSLSDKAPRVKWESARVIGNTAHLFAEGLQEAVNGLLLNSGHEGTVVRWSAAYALGKILMLNSPLNKTLIPAAQAIVEKEEKNSIKKIYIAALKKAK